MTHHQALISSAPAFSPASHFLHAAPSTSPLLFTHSSSTSASCSPAVAPSMASFVAHHHGSLVEREGRMAAALRSSLRPCDVAEEMAAAAAAGPGAWGGLDRGVGDEFFVEELLDLEDLCEVDKDVADLGEAAPSPAVEEDKSSDSHGSSGVSYELMPLPPRVMDLPAHDAEELEWVSRIMDDSLAELPPVPHLSSPSFALRRPAEPTTTVPRMVPVPTTPTICALSTEAFVPVKGKAKRSKRSRGSVWSLSGAAPLSDSTTSSCSTATTSSCSSSSASFPPLLLLDSSPLALLEQAPRSSKKSKHGKNGGGGKPKKRGRKPKHQPRPQFSAGGASAPAPGDRRCSHCGVQKTPQWRAGPEGAKTLCNACGVRYKSGRLLPEYRPACSPTFVSTIHSNSHRKVLEMRRKKEGVLVVVPTATAAAVASF